ncbi:hypothetical protein [Eel River basin pequenovirus]|nr:hypothetical protein [Eel River basin pequenovirus]
MQDNRRVPRGQAAGAAIGSIWGPQGAQAGASIGGGIAAATGGDPYKYWKRQLRKQYHYQARYAGMHYVNQMQRAREAGIHPLVAMGISPIGGSVQAAGIGGQSASGSAISDGFETIARNTKSPEQKELERLQLERAKTDNDIAKEQLLASRQARLAQLSNSQQDIFKTVNLDDIPAAQLIPRGRQQEMQGPFGATWVRKGGRMSAQSMADEYGDLAQEAVGLMNALEDYKNSPFYKNMMRNRRIARREKLDRKYNKKYFYKNRYRSAYSRPDNYGPSSP